LETLRLSHEVDLLKDERIRKAEEIQEKDHVLHRLVDDNFTLGARCDKIKASINVLDRQRREIFISKSMARKSHSPHEKHHHSHSHSQAHHHSYSQASAQENRNMNNPSRERSFSPLRD
jgi:arginine deiminase